MDNVDDMLFYAEFSDGYTFRNLIEYLKNTNTAGNFLFEPKIITYTQINARKTLLNDLKIDTYKLPAYTYNSNQESVAVGLTLNNLRTITRSIGKRDSVAFYMVRDDPRMFIQHTSPNTKELNHNDIGVIRLQKLPVETYDVGTYALPEDQPTATVPILDFSKTCNSLNSIKCRNIVISSDEQGVIFEARLGGDIIGRQARFRSSRARPTRIDKSAVCPSGIGYADPARTARDPSVDTTTVEATEPSYGGDEIYEAEVGTVGDVNTPNGEEIVYDAGENAESCDADTATPIENGDECIRVEASIIKALSKLNNVCPNGTVRIYIEENMPIKIITNVGTYGTLTIYLSDSSEGEATT